MSLLGESVSNEHDAAQRRPDFRSFYGAIFVCLVTAALLMAALLYFDLSDGKKEFLALLAICFLGAALFMTEWKLLFEDWFNANKRLLVNSFSCRDSRGRTRIGRILHRCLISPERSDWNTTRLSLTDLLSRQPAEYLFALAAPQDLRIQSSLSSSLGGGDMATVLRAQPNCHVRTKIFLIESREEYVRTAALDVMPRNLWPRARRKLLRSKYVEARLAAVHSIPEPDILVRVCRDDPAEPVRLLAWQRLGSGLSQRIALELSESFYTDVRILVLKSGKLPRARLVKICARDEDAEVRALAWGVLREALREAEAIELFRSQFLDAKLWAVGSRKLDHTRLRKICFQNPEETIRASAWNQLKEKLTLKDALYLIDSLHVDTRLRTVQSGRLPRWRLLRVALKDEERRIRLETLEQVKVGLAASEANRLRRSLDAEFRVQAVESDLLQPKHVHHLCRNDLSRAVRQAACAKLRS